MHFGSGPDLHHEAADALLRSLRLCLSDSEGCGCLRSVGLILSYKF